MNLYRATENFVYKTDECIGRGATGDVYRGVHKVTGEECALKLCDPRFAQQLQREVEAMKQLQHPNITKFYQLEYDKESTKPILVMELCEKGNLLEVLREPRNAFGLEDKEFLRFFRHLVSGMKHLRQNGFSHRDIKPGNILVYVADDGSYVYKLSDFGTAKPLKDGDFFQSLVGTEEYLHPHIFKAAFIDRYRPREFDISVDLWSLGATLYHAATGKVPFQPYHGRGDKNTMFQMISKKDTGVISGEQTSASGSIIWSKELPKTCMLSKYLRDTLTEFLVRLLECQAHKMWTFDGFFWAADDLLEKHILHLFSVVDSHLYLIYMDPDNKFSDLQKCAQEQMHTQIKSPYFVLHNRELRESVSEEDPVRSYPVTSADDPIVVLPLKEGTLLSTRTSVDSTLSIINEINPEFVDEDSVTRDEDYRMARSMCILTAMILRAIRHAASAHQLLSKTSQSCRYEEQWKFSSLQCSSRCVEERYRDITQIMSTDKRRSLFPIITENGDIDGDNFKQVRWIVEAANGCIKQWQYLAKTLPNSQIPFIGDYVRIVAALCNKYRPPLSVSSEEDQEIAAKMVYLSQRLNTLQIDNRLDICTSLLEECKEKHKKLDELTKIMDSITQENIEASVERTFKQMTDTLQKFSEYRKLSRLSYHDKKLYTFVKTSMTFHYKHAVSYLKKVQHSMATMFTAFRRWHSAYIKVLEAHKEMDTANTEISRQLQELISNVKEPPPLPSVQKPSMKQRHLSEQVKNRVSVISKDISESKQMALESRDHMERWTKLMDDLVDCELSS